MSAWSTRNQGKNARKCHLRNSLRYPHQYCAALYRLIYDVKRNNFWKPWTHKPGGKTKGSELWHCLYIYIQHVHWYGAVSIDTVPEPTSHVNQEGVFKRGVRGWYSKYAYGWGVVLKGRLHKVLVFRGRSGRVYLRCTRYFCLIKSSILHTRVAIT